VAARVADARSRAARRWQATPWRCNAHVPGTALRSPRWLLPPAALRDAWRALESGTLTARGFDRVLRLAWTLADLEGKPQPEAHEVGEALFFRIGRSWQWAA
jgi:magnesium chelatase family protein